MLTLKYARSMYVVYLTILNYSQNKMNSSKAIALTESEQLTINHVLQSLEKYYLEKKPKSFMSMISSFVNPQDHSIRELNSFNCLLYTSDAADE